MRDIAKSPPPPFLAAYVGRTNWDELHEKVELRRQLVQDQRGLCAYCMRRIHPDPVPEDLTRIEHINPRATHPEKTFSWANLVACCDHGRGKPRCEQTCDWRKSAHELSALDVLKPQGIRYGKATGRIGSSHAAVEQDLTKVLNLNHDMLCRGRKAALGDVAQELNRRLKRGEKWKPSQLTTFLANLRSQEVAPEFLGILEWYVNRKLIQASA